jgi:environmental stress-induced protein Ves
MTSRQYEPIDPASYRHVPWKNGGGVTTDIAGEYQPGAEPGGWDGMIWRLGRTRIETPGPFSNLPGYERLLAVIDGSGLVLHPDGRPSLDVRQPYHAVRFGGEWPIQSELTAGPVGVLNLLADRTRIHIELEFLGPLQAMTIPEGRNVLLALSAASLLLDGEAVSLVTDGAISVAGQHQVRVTAGMIAVATVQPVAASS